MKLNYSDFIAGGLATTGACLFSNPIEVVKIRMQLQGELQRTKGITGPYKNPIQALKIIMEKEGIRGIQKGLTSACGYQFVMNGVRLGTYSIFVQLYISMQQKKTTTELSSNKLSKKETMKNFLIKFFAGSMAGVIGGVTASPLYLVKTRMQSKSTVFPIGAQHDYKSTIHGLKEIYKNEGRSIGALYNGSRAASLRLGCGSAIQLSTYDTSKDIILTLFPSVKQESMYLHLGSSLISGIAVTTGMNPLDVVATRIYNQKMSPSGKGLLYSGPIDCLIKTFKAEGIRGLYKGWTGHYLRIAPHCVLTFVFLEQIRYLFQSFKK
eukprot:TRINITY_DN2122_c0_g1_i1.p1 TRINITY_DN2122_c0_g1~~TRINITY_DN2122_c0_g1_i1.p1  ORF type:complete len:323 (-),score=63.26 TRINITY_DN2122_c0_g1_i1:287-1255(-)